MSDRRLVVWLSVGLVSWVANGLAGSPVAAQDSERADEWMSGRVDESEQFIQPSTPQPATSVDEWVAQLEASLTQITGVRIEETETGLQIVLETAEGELPVPTTQMVGNALIAEIPNAVLALPDGESFEQFSPAEGIALVSVTNEPGDRVRVAITGTDAPPVGEVTATGLTLTLGEAVADTDDNAIQVVVTGEQDEGYNPSSASTATRTDTPLRDIPSSIQVVPQEVLEDRQVRSLTEAVETVSGIVEDYRYLGSTSGVRRIRGFAEGNTFRNGFREGGIATTVPFATIEQVEILKGPASVLFGAIEPGGIINYVTRQPLSEPYYRLGFEAGNFGRYQPSIDLSGPLTADESVLYRFIASHEYQNSYQEFANSAVTTIAPSIALRLGDQTDINLYYEYSRFLGDPIVRYAVRFSDGSLSPRRFHPNYPELNRFESVSHKAGYALTHEISDRWQIRNNFAATIASFDFEDTFRTGVIDDRFLTFGTFEADTDDENYFAGVDLLGNLNTGSILHRVLIGFDFNYFTGSYEGAGNYDDTIIPPLDIRNPDYDAVTERPEVFPDFASLTDRRSYGIYLQDQITFSDQWKLLIGGRYDWISEESGSIPAGTEENLPTQNDGAFSPRIGLIYQPIENVSLYASYSRSFSPAIGRNPDNEIFEPTRGTQYEIGVKTDFLDGRLSATLAAYNLARTNVLTPSPDPVLAQQGFQVQVGEQRSQGIELDVTGEILPGWNIIASYALTDTEVTNDNSIPSTEGNRFPNVPLHQASLWTTYEIQEGDLQGLGFGLGLFYLGERQGDLANTFQVGDYLRTDAALYYRRDRFNAAINIRNLFNIDYVNSVAFSDPQSIDRGEPFTIIGSVGWEF